MGKHNSSGNNSYNNDDNIKTVVAIGVKCSHVSCVYMLFCNDGSKFNFNYISSITTEWREQKNTCISSSLHPYLYFFQWEGGWLFSIILFIYRQNCWLSSYFYFWNLTEPFDRSNFWQIAFTLGLSLFSLFFPCRSSYFSVWCVVGWTFLYKKMIVSFNKKNKKKYKI